MKFQAVLFAIFALVAVASCTHALDPLPIPTIRVSNPAPAMTTPEKRPLPTTPAAENESAPAMPTPAVLTQADLERIVTADLAAKQGFAPSETRVVLAELRRWPDAGLGCVARQGVFEPRPAPGYLIIVEAGGRAYEYHTDLQGNFLLCPAVGKPLGPIK